MKVKGISVEQLRDCLERVNRTKGYRLIFNRQPEKKGNFIHFTIRSERSRIPGSRLNWQLDRHLVAASWTAHGYLFDEIYNVNPSAVIVTGGQRLTSVRDNWKDIQIGSMINPCYMSETCIL